MSARQHRHYKPKGRTPDRHTSGPLDPKRKPTAAEIIALVEEGMPTAAKPEANPPVEHWSVSCWFPSEEPYGRL